MVELYLIHPMVVHFTIALFFLSVFFDVVGTFTKKVNFHIAAWYNLIFACVSVIVTVIFGLVAEERAPHTEAGHKLLETHETIGFIVLGIILLLTIWRIVSKGQLPGKGKGIYLLISVLGVGLVSVGGYYGGEMVYTTGFGVKTAPHTMHMHNEDSLEHDQMETDEQHQQMDDSTHTHQNESMPEH